jgi:NAD-dependent dihydropyrimidine dehydrogenase PreA subunit
MYRCGVCVANCPHGVYDIDRAPSPVVKNPEACVDHCHGCGNRCPAGAIAYVGDDTGWTPPGGGRPSAGPCCSCGCGGPSEKTVLAEYLYLDLQTCGRCMGTDEVLGEVLAALAPALKLAGYGIEYKKIKMETAELAERYQFLSSPTIRINGYDIGETVRENSCGDCSEISGGDIDCRVFEYEGTAYEVPPREMLAEAILKNVFGRTGGGPCAEYKLPRNLKAFFEGKDGRSFCFCGGKCR